MRSAGAPPPLHPTGNSRGRRQRRGQGGGERSTSRVGTHQVRIQVDPGNARLRAVGATGAALGSVLAQRSPPGNRRFATLREAPTGFKDTPTWRRPAKERAAGLTAP